MVSFDTLASGRFRGFLWKKQANHMWLCVRVTPAPKVVESSSEAQKTWQVF